MSAALRPAIKKIGRANGLQDAHQPISEGYPPPAEAMVRDMKQEAADATNPAHVPTNADAQQQQRSKWTDVNRTQPQQSSQPQQWDNNQQHPQEHMWQEMQRRDKARLQQQQQQQQQNQSMLQYNCTMPGQKQQPTPNGQVTNGLCDIEEPKNFKPFNAKNSAMLANAGNVNLQQSSMANGLLQNQQQRNQQAIDNTWSGQAPMQQGQFEGNPNMAPQQSYEVIQSSEPGKAPQFVLRNASQECQGFPPQRSPGMGMGRCCGPMRMNNPPTMMQPGQMMSSQMMQPPMMQPQMMAGAQMMMPPQGMMQPGMAAHTMPPGMAHDIMPQPPATQPSNAYPYGYGASASGNQGYQPAYANTHGMHGQSANTTICQNAPYN